MKRTTKNLMTIICCTALMAAAGCSSTGELSITGMYGSQGQALSGDRCDELLMDAAEADTAEAQEEAQRDYRECVEEALAEDGRDGECRDDDDHTCDVILEEVGDAIERLRGEGSEAPECDAPSTNSEEALCHLMAAYEACELDRDDDGDPDVDDRPDEGEDSDKPEGDDETSAECEEVRDRVENVGEEDAMHIKENNPECFGEGGAAPDETEGEEPKEGEEGEAPPAEDGEGSADEFCQALEAEIDQTDDAEKLAYLQETYDRECTP